MATESPAARPTKSFDAGHTWFVLAHLLGFSRVEDLAFAFDELSASYRLKVYFHSSVVGAFSSYEIRDTEGTLLDEGESASDGFDDDFETGGSLDPALWTTYQSGSTGGVTLVSGRYRNLIDDDSGTGNRSLWFNAADGRMDYQTPGSLTFEFIAYNVGIGTLADSQAVVPDTGDFQFCGIMVHVETLATVSYRTYLVGHRGGTAFTIEAKNTLNGSSNTTDEGANFTSGATRMDLRVVGNGDGTVSFYNRTALSSDPWTLGTSAGFQNPEPFGVNMRVGLVAYKFDEFAADFVGTCDAWERIDT